MRLQNRVQGVRDAIMLDRMMGGMGLMMLVGLLVVAAVIATAVYLAIRAASPSSREPLPLEKLQERLASGEITPEDYYERESALRSGQSSTGRRR